MLDSKRKSDTLPTYMALMPQSLSGSTQVLDILPIAASLLDEKGVVVYVNKVWRDYYASPDYVPTLLKPNANYLEACRDDQTDSRDASQTIYQEMIKLLDGEREQSTIEYINRWQDKDLWSSVRLARLSSGTQIYLLLLHEHISERKITELDLQEQQRLNELLREVAKKLASTLNVEEVMELILESVALLVPHDAANISLIEGDLVRAAYVRGYGEEFSRVSKAYRWPLHEGLYAEMMATRYPLVITDTDSSPLWRHVEGLNVVRSYVGVPIISQDQVQGFLNLDSFSTFEYTPRHLETLMAFAEHAAMAISNAQVYVTLDNFNAELSAILQATTALFKPIRPYETASDLAQDLIEALQQAFEGVSCGVFMRTDAGPDLKCAASVGSYVVAQRIFSPHESTGQEGLALLAAAFRTRQPVHVPRLGNANPGSITELVIPIITNRGVFALMHLQSREKDAFQERDMRILNAFAQHMAVAAENFQLYQTMQQHNTELEDAIVQRTLELRRAKEDVESILNSTSDAISVLDVQARIVKCNAAFESSFGIEADEAYRQSMSMFFTQESRSTFQTLFNRVLETGLSVQGELLAEWKQGEDADKERRVVEVVLSQVQRVDDDDIRIVCSTHDISRHKELMITLQRALEREHELNDMKSQFLSVATHEFRTPLTSITLITGTLQDYLKQLDEQKIRTKLTSIQDQVKRMTSLIDDVLTLGRSEAGEWPFNPNIINLPELLAKLGAEWQSALASQHQLFIACSGTEETVYADPDLLEHILINLVSNAVKYSLPGSQIKIKAQITEYKCLIDVIDQGIGIPAQEQSKLFESFYRASNARKISGVSGTGLGLVIVKRAAEMHGGDITFVSTEGRGTTFSVELPRMGVNGQAKMQSGYHAK